MECGLQSTAKRCGRGGEGHRANCLAGTHAQPHRRPHGGGRDGGGGDVHERGPEYRCQRAGRGAAPAQTRAARPSWGRSTDRSMHWHGGRGYLAAVCLFDARCVQVCGVTKRGAAGLHPSVLCWDEMRPPFTYHKGCALPPFSYHRGFALSPLITPQGISPPSFFQYYE